jgi:type II secretory pathway pseudopilin PulG
MTHSQFHTSQAGFGLLEAIMAMSLILLISLSATQTLLFSNRNAATSRVLTAARTIVQRNLDTAMSLRFDGSTAPAVLAITPAAGQVYDDDGTADNLVNILTEKTGSTQTVLVKGTLTRIVAAEPNPQNADIRRVTFRLTYPFQRRNFVVEMTSLRTIDD